MKHIGRKLYHLLGGIGLLALYYLLGRERALLLYVALFIAALSLDIARLGIPAVNRFVFDHFSAFIRRSEEHKLTGTPAYLLGIALSLYLYEPPAATAAICFLACGDVAATAIGERWGGTKIGDKSLEGTAAFVAASFIAGAVLHLLGLGPALWIAAIGALTAAGVELLSLPVNDNLLIPLASGGVMQVIIHAAY